MPSRQHHAIGALQSWANTVDRSARTARGRANSPSSLDWHLKRLPEKFQDATEEQRLAAADAARKLYFARLSQRSAAARSRRPR